MQCSTMFSWNGIAFQLFGHVTRDSQSPQCSSPCSSFMFQVSMGSNNRPALRRRSACRWERCRDMMRCDIVIYVKYGGAKHGARALETEQAEFEYDALTQTVRQSFEFSHCLSAFHVHDGQTSRLQQSEVCSHCINTLLTAAIILLDCVAASHLSRIRTF